MHPSTAINMNLPLGRYGLSLFTCCLLTASSQAQWSADAAVNLSIGDGASDQNQPKIVATPDGGCYVSWIDGIGTGWDVRLQKLSAAGNEEWAHGGVLVRDRSYSSTQDYGLDVDAVGAAVLAFRDDNFANEQVTVARVSTSGVLIWGANGVQVTNTTNFIASPRVTGTANGDLVVTWTENSLARVMRLQPNGGTAWPMPVDLTPAAGSYSPSDIHATADDVIVSMVHQPSGFSGPKHLLAQKLDFTGAPLWGASPLAVFDGGSLQFGNFPTFVTDGSGGAVFGWYGTGPLQCYAQHVLANGTEAFPHNGVAGSTDLTGTRVSPSVDFDPASSSTYLFWEEQNGAQSMSGLSGQKFDAAGNAQWGATGASFVPLSTTEINWVRTLATQTGAFVFWHAEPGFGNAIGRGGFVDPGGVMTAGPVTYASTPSNKTRLAATLLSSGDAALVWSDDRVDGGDILVQNMQPDGTLGGGSLAGSLYCFGVSCSCANNDPNAGCANGTGAGALLSGAGGPSIGAATFSLQGSQLPPGQPGLYFQGENAINGGNGIPFGDGLRCAGMNVVRLEVRNSDGAGNSSTTIDIANKGGVVAGDTRRYQLWYRDPAGSPCGTFFNLSNGFELIWQP